MTNPPAGGYATVESGYATVERMASFTEVVMKVTFSTTSAITAPM